MTNKGKKKKKKKLHEKFCSKFQLAFISNLKKQNIFPFLSKLSEKSSTVTKVFTPSVDKWQMIEQYPFK